MSTLHLKSRTITTAAGELGKAGLDFPVPQGVVLSLPVALKKQVDDMMAGLDFPTPLGEVLSLPVALDSFETDARRHC